MHPSYELCQIYPQNAHFECICISAKIHCICISTKIQCICISTWKYLYFHPDTLCTVVLWYNAPSCDSISGLSPRQQHLQGASKKKHPPITSSYKYKKNKQTFAIFCASKKHQPSLFSLSTSFTHTISIPCTHSSTHTSSKWVSERVTECLDSWTTKNINSFVDVPISSSQFLFFRCHPIVKREQSLSWVMIVWLCKSLKFWSQIESD